MRHLFLFLLAASVAFTTFAQEQPPPKDPTGAVQQKGSAEWLLNQGREQNDSRRYDQAIESFTQALKLKPDMILAYHGLATAYLRIGDTTKALATAQKAVEVNANDPNSHLAMAQVYLGLRRFNDAIEAYKKVTQLAPGFGLGFYDLGTAYLQAGKPAEAVVPLKEGVRLNPNWVSGHMNLAIAYLETKQDDAGIAQLKQALKVEPNAFFAAHRLGKEGIRLGRISDALQGYEMLSHAPMQPQACENIVFATLYTGKGEVAARTAQECLQMKGKRDRAAPYVALFEYFAWRVAKKETQAGAALANEALTELQTQLNPGQWPLPVVKYLRRELSAEELLKQANNNDEQTEARAYLGCDLSLSGKPDEAIPHLRWVKEYGNRNFVEYPLAVLELHRIEELQKKQAK
jgi:tetratricopeptide (TPR) repeat protein